MAKRNPTPEPIDDIYRDKAREMIKKAHERALEKRRKREEEARIVARHRAELEAEDSEFSAVSGLYDLRQLEVAMNNVVANTSVSRDAFPEAEADDEWQTFFEVIAELQEALPNLLRALGHEPTGYHDHSTAEE